MWGVGLGPGRGTGCECVVFLTPRGPGTYSDRETQVAQIPFLLAVVTG